VSVTRILMWQNRSRARGAKRHCMPGLIVAFLALALPCYASDTRHFFGAWEPPPSLQEFWLHVSDSWWRSGEGATPNFKRRCHDFAKQHRLEQIIPDMIADLRANPSEVRWFVYLQIMLDWPKDRVLTTLQRFQQSPDVEVKHIANEFYADVE
jgi:hypothetical protein